MATRQPDATTTSQDVELVYQQFGISQNTKPLSDDCETRLPQPHEPDSLREPIYMPGLSRNTRALATR